MPDGRWFQQVDHRFVSATIEDRTRIAGSEIRHEEQTVTAIGTVGLTVQLEALQVWGGSVVRVDAGLAEMA